MTTKRQILGSICGTKNKKHGDASNYKRKPAKEYVAWWSMKSRCYNENNCKFLIYGGRGIKVCNQWIHNYPQFLKDMGRKPTKKHSLDRINVNGNYEPMNCRWATYKQQNRNRRFN